MYCPRSPCSLDAVSTRRPPQLRRAISVSPERPLLSYSPERVRNCPAHLLNPLVRVRATQNLDNDSDNTHPTPDATPTRSRAHLRAPLCKPVPRRASAASGQPGKAPPPLAADVEPGRRRSQTRRRQSTPPAPPVRGL